MALRKPVGTFLEGLAPRVTKLSAFKIDIELREGTGLKKWSPPSLDEIRQPLAAETLGDATDQLMDTFAQETSIDYAVVDLGDGMEWLTSRIFILSVLLERMRGLRCVVFVETQNGVRERFVGLATPRHIRWTFAEPWPWLEAAYVRAYQNVVFGEAPATMLVQNSPIFSDRGALEPYVAQQIFASYIGQAQNGDALQTTQPQAPDHEWVDITVDPNSPRWERAEWTNGTMLSQVLGKLMWKSKVIASDDRSSDTIAHAVLRRSSPFVALLDEDRAFSTLVDREALLEQVARSLDKTPPDYTSSEPRYEHE
jgi:hypothetical protein